MRKNVLRRNYYLRVTAVGRRETFRPRTRYWRGGCDGEGRSFLKVKRQVQFYIFFKMVKVSIAIERVKREFLALALQTKGREREGGEGSGEAGGGNRSKEMIRQRMMRNNTLRE